MGEVKTATQIRAQFIALMGAELGELHYTLRNEVIWVWRRWYQFRELFATTQARVDILNRAAPAFFTMLHDILWETVLLNLAKLTDPPGQGQRQNLTIHRLPALIADPSLSTHVAALVGEADSRVAFARTWRNKHIAHADLAVALKRSLSPLPPVTVLRVTEALRGLSDICDAIDLHYLQSTTAFDFGPAPGEAPSMVTILRLGLEARDARLARLRAGSPLPEDLAPSQEA